MKSNGRSPGEQREEGEGEGGKETEQEEGGSVARRPGTGVRARAATTATRDLPAPEADGKRRGEKNPDEAIFPKKSDAKFH